MRPGDFSPGNAGPKTIPVTREPCFNEAGGFLPRKRDHGRRRRSVTGRCFNEAGGFLPRKPMTAARQMKEKEKPELQ